jgi:hypothetical protein
MLSFLKQKKKSNSLNSFPGAYAALFYPLLLPSYRAGYMMNLTTDVPPGSIVAAPSGSWYDAKVLGLGSKLMTRGNQTLTGLVNGFKCENIDIASAKLRNTTTDILTGIQNYSYVLGFKRNLAGTGHMLLSSRNDADTIGAYSLIQNDGKLRLTLSSGANSADAITASRYDDNAWHAIVCIIDQTSKSARIVTHTGESITNVEALLPAPINFTMTNFNYFQFGGWWVASLNYAPGFFGDIITFNIPFSNSMINAIMAWECDRLGIAHVPV